MCYNLIYYYSKTSQPKSKLIKSLDVYVTLTEDYQYTCNGQTRMGFIKSME